MEKSWRTGKLLFPPSVATIADGIGVRVPIKEAVDDMQGLVDDVLLVEDREIIAATREGREPNSSVAQVLDCYRVLGELEQQLFL